jgi:Nodulation protein S (NodS)
VRHMSATDFEARYRADPDPWGYTGSDYERSKYAATLAACGDGPFAHALELGGSIGVFSALLAPCCGARCTRARATSSASSTETRPIPILIICTDCWARCSPIPR